MEETKERQSSVASLRNIIMEELTFNGAATSERLIDLYGATGHPDSYIRSALAMLVDEDMIEMSTDGRWMVKRNG